MTSYYPPQYNYTKFNPLNFETKTNIEKKLNTVQRENNTIKTNIDTLETKTNYINVISNQTVLSSNLVPNHDGNHRLGLSENNTFNFYGNKLLINDGALDTNITAGNIETLTGIDAINQAIYFNTDINRAMYIGQGYENGNNSNNGFTIAISGGSGANPNLCWLSKADGIIYNRQNLRNDDIQPNIDNTYSAGNGTYRWDDIYASNGTINTSDQRQKKDIENLDTEKTINFIKSLRPVRYKWKNGKRFHSGLIYQELEPHSTQFLKEWGLLSNINDSLGVRYDELYAILIKTYQYLIEKNELLENRLNILSK